MYLYGLGFSSHFFFSSCWMTLVLFLFLLFFLAFCSATDKSHGRSVGFASVWREMDRRPCFSICDAAAFEQRRTRLDDCHSSSIWRRGKPKLRRSSSSSSRETRAKTRRNTTAPTTLAPIPPFDQTLFFFFLLLGRPFFVQVCLLILERLTM